MGEKRNGPGPKAEATTLCDSIIHPFADDLKSGDGLTQLKDLSEQAGPYEMSSTLGCALDALRYGPVLRLPSASKVPYRGSHGYRDATRDPDEVRAMWADKDHNVGIATGNPCEDGFLLVADHDRYKAEAVSVGGLAAFLGLSKAGLLSTRRVASPGGGDHYYLLSSRPLPSTVPLPGVELRGVGTYVLAPGSSHPDGGLYGVGLDAPMIRLSEAGAARCESAKTTRAPARVRKPDKTASPLSESLPIPAGLVGDETARLLCQVGIDPNPGKTFCFGGHDDATPSLHITRHPERGTLIHCFGCRAGRKELRVLAHGVDDLLDEIESFALAALWPGSAGNTDRRVLLALTAKARELGTKVLSMSVRAIAVETEAAPSTVHRSLRRLTDRGAITRVALRRAEHAGTLALLKPPAEPTCAEAERTLIGVVFGKKGTPPIKVRSRVAQLAEARSPAWCWPGLGSSSRVYGVLGSDPMSVAEVASFAGLDRSGAYRHLVKLERVGLASRSRRGRADVWIRTGKSLDRVVAELGLRGRAERRKAEFAAEREIRRQALDLFRARRGPPRPPSARREGIAA